jgi:hypothetical protein
MLFFGAPALSSLRCAVTTGDHFMHRLMRAVILAVCMCRRFVASAASSDKHLMYVTGRGFSVAR